MEDRLNQIAERLRQVERELADPAVYSDQQRLKNLSREQKELTPVVETFTALQQTEQAIAEAREMLSDQELRELAQEELTRTKEQRERLAEELKRLLLPRDPNDEKSVVLEIRGGVGGEEGALFAADLLRMYTMYAERRGWQLEIVSQNVKELGGVKEVCATVEGDGAWSRLKFEAGTHRVQRVPETESGGRIQTSAATVAVMPEAEEDLETLAEDICQVTDAALAAYNRMRSVEGVKLAEDIAGRADTIEDTVARVEAQSPQTVSAYRERLESKMREVLASTTIDEARILTETAIFADKIAVDEETVRLHSHLSQLRDMLQGDEPVGRKLDFLIQEINRECNTIGSKCSDLTITQDVVNMKAEVEKIREQVQNIE